MKRFVVAVFFVCATARAYEVPLVTPCTKDALDERNNATAFAIIDVSTASNPASYYVRREKNPPKPIGTLLQTITDICGTTTPAFNKIHELLLDGTTGLARSKSRRAFLGSGDTIVALVLHRFDDPNKIPFKLLVTETPRPTEFMRGLESLLQAREELYSETLGADIHLSQGLVELQEPRGEVTFSILGLKPETAGGGATASTKEKTDQKKKAAKSEAPEEEKKQADVLKLVTGSPEHLTWSANVPLNSVKAVKYNDKERTFEAREAPKEFLAALDLSAGDVLMDYPWYDWHRLQGKGIFRFSKNPGDTLGVGLGFRLPFVNVWGGRLWMKEDEQVGNQRSDHYRIHTRFGLGLDVSTIVKSLKAANAKK
jgi:hypothetical protein